MAASPDALVANLSQAARGLLTAALTHCYELVVRGISHQCSRCGLDRLAVALIHTHTRASLICDEASAAGGVTLSFAKELLEEARHPAAATIKHRRSEDGGDQYVSNGCGRCDAMFDPFELEDAIAAVQVQREVSSLPVLARVSRTHRRVGAAARVGPDQRL